MKIDAQKLINKLGELATDIEENLLLDYYDMGGIIDIDNWDADSDGETIAYDIGYKNACLNVIKMIKNKGVVK